MKPTILCLTLSVAIFIGSNCLAQESAGTNLGRASAPVSTIGHTEVGHVHFPTSCTAAAQEQFDLGVSMVHSFFYPETVNTFTKVADIDPTCAMAYWGIAISQRPNPLVPPFDPANLKRGYEALQKGLSLNPKTQRETDWLNTMLLFFKDADTIDQMTRTKRYEEGMEQLHKRYPDDIEAAVFYALSLLETTSLDDKTYSNQLQAVAILEKVAAVQPDHPGVVHYVIHSDDYQPLAARGLPSADKYASIAPSAPHAQHMPAHIYSMLGMWEASIKSNRASLVVAKEYAAKNYAGFSDSSQPHSLDFMEHAYLQLGQDKQAKAVVDEAASMMPVKFVRASTETGLAAIPARYVLERNAWAEATRLEPRASSYPYVEAITHFARAMGLARTGDPGGARQELARLSSLQQTLLGQQGQAFWAQQTEVLFEGASAWTARAAGNDSEALKMMRAAADLEDSTEKNVAMENRLYPMRESLGYLLLELNQPKQALAEFQVSAKLTPNRLRGLYGAGKAAQLSGDNATARDYYEKLITLTENADSDRPELMEVRAFLANSKTQASGSGLKANSRQ